MMARGGRTRLPFRRVPLSMAPPELKNTLERTSKDCSEVKSILAAVSNFPPELTDMVMELAEYWVCSVASIDFSKTGRSAFTIHGSRPGEDKFLLRTEPVGLTSWHPDDEKRWADEAAPQKLQEEYTREELEGLNEECPSTLTHPFRKIVFDIVSRDQGYTSEAHSKGTFRSSWTWFDVGIDRFDKSHTCSELCTGQAEAAQAGDTSKAQPVPRVCAIRPVWPYVVEKDDDSSHYHHDLLPISDHKIQCNRTAEGEFEHHHVEWSWTDDIDPHGYQISGLDDIGRGTGTGDGKFVRDLKVGDMVTVWGRARFPGWINSIQKVEVRVYWAL